MARKAKKKSIAATARSLAANFGKLALDAQRVALMEMVSVYERASASARKVGKKVKKGTRAGKKRAVKAGTKAGKVTKSKRARKSR